MFRNLKMWKTIIQFVITVLTAIISSFFVQSCVQSVSSSSTAAPRAATVGSPSRTSSPATMPASGSPAITTTSPATASSTRRTMRTCRGHMPATTTSTPSVFVTRVDCCPTEHLPTLVPGNRSTPLWHCSVR